MGPGSLGLPLGLGPLYHQVQDLHHLAKPGQSVLVVLLVAERVVVQFVVLVSTLAWQHLFLRLSYWQIL